MSKRIPCDDVQIVDAMSDLICFVSVQRVEDITPEMAEKDGTLVD